MGYIARLIFAPDLPDAHGFRNVFQCAAGRTQKKHREIHSVYSRLYPLSIYLYMFLYVIGIGWYLINQNSLPAVPSAVEVCTVNFIIKEDFVIHR